MTTDETANPAAETDSREEFENILEAQASLEETIAGLMASMDTYMGELEAHMKRLEQNLDELLVTAAVQDCPGLVN